MPSPSTTQLPRPKSWDEFEDIVADLVRIVWKDQFITRNGRSGQKQNGIDIYGYPPELEGQPAAVQCKRTDLIDIDSIRAEVEQAKLFKPPLGFYLITTTAPRDAAVQQDVRTGLWPFRVHIWFWDDISLELSGHELLLQKHFPGWMKHTTTENHVIEMIRNSEPEDWSYDDSTGIYVYKKDVDFRLIQDREDEDGQFEEPWVKRFPSPYARRQIIYATYRSSRILTMYFVNTDGGRYTLPYPKSHEELIITPFQYHVGRILRGKSTVGYGYDSGLRMAGIKVVAPASADDLTHNAWG